MFLSGEKDIRNPRKKLNQNYFIPFVIDPLREQDFETKNQTNFIENGFYQVLTQRHLAWVCVSRWGVHKQYETKIFSNSFCSNVNNV